MKASETPNSRIINALLSLFFVFSLVQPGKSQEIGLTLTVAPLPSPYTADWEFDRTIADIAVFSEQPQAREIYLYVSVEEDELGPAAFARTAPFTLPAGFFQTNFDNTYFFRNGDVDYAEGLKDKMASGSRFPDGNYTICVEARSVFDEVLASSCGFFSTMLTETPLLLIPFNSSTVADPYPLFQWTPVNGFTVTAYEFSLYEVFDNQHFAETVERNLTFYREIFFEQTSFLYPPDAPELIPGRQYAWQVRVVDPQGRPLGINQGYTEIFTFHYRPLQQTMPPDLLPTRISWREGSGELDILYPKPDSVILSWEEEWPSDQAPLFELRVWQSEGGPDDTVSLFEAGLDRQKPLLIVQNIPDFSQALTPDALPLETGKCYWFQVRPQGTPAGADPEEFPAGRFCLRKSTSELGSTPDSWTDNALCFSGTSLRDFSSPMSFPDWPSPALAQQQRKVRVRGSLAARAAAYDVTGIAPRYDPFTGAVSGAPVLYIGNWQISSQILLGNLGRSFGQNFNKLGISPQYKWLTLHAGHQNIRFSEYSLAGRTFLGGGIELNPGKFRFGAVYGQFQNAVEEFIDTLFFKPAVIAYERWGYAVKLGVGSSENFVDLVFFKAKDDSLSISTPNRNFRTSPEENAVISLVSQQRIAKRLFFDIEAALSAYTRNTQSSESDLEDNFWTAALRSVIVPRFATEYHYAGHAGLRYQGKLFRMEMRYQRIDTDFRSMGAFFLLNDVERITVTPDFVSKDNKFRLRASVGYQRNNVAGMRANSTFRKIGMINGSYQFAKNLQFNITYNNFQIEQQRERDLLEDSLLLLQNTASLTAGFRYTIQTPSSNQMVLFNGNWRKLKDRSDFTDNGFQSQGFNLHYTLNLRETRWNFSYGLSYNIYDFRGSKREQVRNSASIGKQWLDNRLNAGAGFAIVHNLVNEEVNNLMLVPRLNASYRAGRKHLFTLQANLLDSRSRTAEGRDFTESRGEVRYTFRF
jgi:hypothetical protein